MAILIKPDSLRALDVTVRTAFMDAYGSTAYTPRYPGVATVQPSGSAKNIYPSMIDAASVREWVGERVINPLVLEGASVTNQKWELTYSVQRDALDDDQSGAVGMLMSRVRSGGGKFLRHKDKLVFTVLKANATCLDGVALFNGSHPVNPKDAGAGTFDNDIGTTALTANNAAAVRASMMELKGPDGDPINENPRLIIVPPALELTARKIAEADEIVFSGNANESNVFKGQYDVIVVPQLAASFASGSDTTWYMADVSDAEDRGLIMQEREAVEITSLFSLTDPQVFTRDEYQWGARARYVAAAGNPKKIFRCTA
jgi:phage major head subunit gpT-like protein